MKTNFKEVKIYDLDPIQFREDIIKHVKLLISDLTKQLEPDKPEVWLTRKDASKFLGVSLMTIHDWSKKGILKPKKIGTRIRFRQSDIIEVLNKSNY